LTDSDGQKSPKRSLAAILHRGITERWLHP